MTDAIPTDETTFAGRFRAAMKARGFTQRAVADGLGLGSATQISHWATGRRGPSAENLQQLASLLDVDGDWLAGEADGVSEPLASRLRRPDGLLSMMGSEGDGIDAERAGALRGLFAAGAEGISSNEESDYLTLMSFVFLAGKWNASHGWKIRLEADIGNGRIISVQPQPDSETGTTVQVGEYWAKNGPLATGDDGRPSSGGGESGREDDAPSSPASGLRRAAEGAAERRRQADGQQPGDRRATGS